MFKPAAGLLIALTLTACGQAPSYVSAPRNAVAGVTQARAITTVEVAIQDMAFAPNTLTVARGTKVVWTNRDEGMPHTVTSDTNAFTSGRLGDAQSFSFSFDQAGTFPYHCRFHGMMKGTVVVQ